MCFSPDICQPSRCSFPTLTSAVMLESLAVCRDPGWCREYTPDGSCRHVVREQSARGAAAARLGTRSAAPPLRYLISMEKFSWCARLHSGTLSRSCRLFSSLLVALLFCSDASLEENSRHACLVCSSPSACLRLLPHSFTPSAVRVRVQQTVNKVPFVPSFSGRSRRHSFAFRCLLKCIFLFFLSIVLCRSRYLLIPTFRCMYRCPLGLERSL